MTSPERHRQGFVCFAAIGKPRWIALGVLLAIVLGMFGDVLLSSQAVVLSRSGLDAELCFIPWRQFGFSQLRQGNLPLWNPYTLSGSPCFGCFQAALLYPLNWPYLVLPIDRAINVDIVTHLLLTGLFQFAWMSYRGLSALASLLSAVLLMFGAPCYFHLYSGHVSLLAVMAWAPLIFLVCDGLAAKPSLGWCLLGAFAVAMQLLAGYPQLFVYTLIAVGLYSLLTFPAVEGRLRAFLGLAALYVAGAALAGVQLFTGLETVRESVRGNGGLPYEVAASFSLPPENVLTWLAPGFFGDLKSFPYWGRCYLWEVSLYMGIAGLLLALGGVLYAPQHARRPVLKALAMAAILLLLSVAAQTPLFRLLYDYVPGFDKFRSTSKFVYAASIFLAQLAGCGCDYLFQSPRRFRSLAVVALTLALAAGAGCLAIHISAEAGDQGAWAKVPAAVRATGETELPADVYKRPDFATASGMHAGNSLLIASAVAAVLSLLLFFAAREHFGAAYGVAVFAMFELLVWSRTYRPTFDLATIQQPWIEQFVKEHPGDYRTLNPEHWNFGMSIGVADIGGYEPFASRRYAEFIAFSQGRDPDRADAYVTCTGYDPLYRLLRCRHVFLSDKNGSQIKEFQSVLPHLLLIHDYSVVTGRDPTFQALTNPAFDPQRQVILPRDPDPRPDKSQTGGTATLVDSSTDHLTIEAELPAPAILLITDSYREGWQATGLPGSDQQAYDVMPANYVLRAIPLTAGRHRLRLEYSPRGFRLGAGVSIIALAMFLLLAARHLRQSCSSTRRSE